MRVEVKLLKANLDGAQAEGGGDVLTVDRGWDIRRGGVVSTNRGFMIGIISAEVNETASGRRDRVTIGEAGGLHHCGLPSDTIFLCMKEEGHSGCCNEDVVGGISRDDALVAVKQEVRKWN